MTIDGSNINGFLSQMYASREAAIRTLMQRHCVTREALDKGRYHLISTEDLATKQFTVSLYLHVDDITIQEQL